jgi:hypothetical protein
VVEGCLDGKEIRSIIKTSDGGYAGLTWGLDYDDYEILKFDADFNIVRDKTYGGSSEDYAASIVQTDDGGYLVIGHSRSTDGGGYIFIGTTDLPDINYSSDYASVFIDLEETITGE